MDNFFKIISTFLVIGVIFYLLLWREQAKRRQVEDNKPKEVIDNLGELKAEKTIWRNKVPKWVLVIVFGCFGFAFLALIGAGLETIWPATPTTIKTTPTPTFNRVLPTVTPTEPSAQSLKVASQVFVYSNQQQQQELINNWSLGTGNQNDAIRNLALSFDKNPEQLALSEAAITKYLNELSRQSYIQSYRPSINCTTNTIGNYTYTNCY